jgi:hypothetical protein
VPITRNHARVLEAMAVLVLARAAVRTIPLRRLAWLTGPVSQGDASHQSTERSGDPRVRLVAASLRRGAARLPWHSGCLVRALAGGAMLRRRRIASTLVVGVARDAAGLRAHAWLVADGGTVCGGREAVDFRPIAAFRA